MVVQGAEPCGKGGIRLCEANRRQYEAQRDRSDANHQWRRKLGCAFLVFPIADSAENRFYIITI